MTTLPTEGQGPPSFVTTRWTQVLSARGQTPAAQAALGELCVGYWMPIFRFIRRSGYDEDTARDQTQEFIAKLLTKNGLEAVEPSKGKFRSYLLGAVKHFLSDQRDKASALKRGGGQEAIPLEEQTGNSTTTRIPDPVTLVADAFFDRQWALNLIERVLQQLQLEMGAVGKESQFQALKPWLIGDVTHLSQEEAGRTLGLSEGAVKVAVHRLRKRFRALVKEEIVQTVNGPDDVQEELRYLITALSQGEA